MDDVTISEAHECVAAVRAAETAHRATWEALVPNQFDVNLSAESAEETAYAEMARAKAALREHIRQTYGISVRELSSLAMP